MDMEFQFIEEQGKYQFGIEREYDTQMITLSIKEIIENYSEDNGDDCETGMYERTHFDGWVIRGLVTEDYFYWVDYFEAVHPFYGRVWCSDSDSGIIGQNITIHADSEDGYKAFCESHSFTRWDSDDQ